MKIAILSSFEPFVIGGARFIVEWLEEKLREAGHEVERFYLPFVEDPETLLEQTAAWRMLKLERCDRVVCIRPPAHVIEHPGKVLWFIHHIRAYYDLWDTPYVARPTPKLEAVRKALIAIDTKTIKEARAVFTNSQVVADRLKVFNGIDAQPLYPPLYKPERFRNDGYGESIVSVCRMESHKRQHLLIEAMRHTKSDVRLHLCGLAANPGYMERLHKLIDDGRLHDRVTLDERWVSEEEKADVIAGALAVAYAPADEDSYGYPSLEGAHASKALLTTADSGGVMEFAQDGRNGYVVEPDPAALGEAMDRLHRDRQRTIKMGQAAHDRISELKIDWGTVVERLTA